MWRQFSISEMALPCANDGLWDYEAQTNHTWFSPRWKAMLGFAEGDVITSPDAFDTVKAAMEAAGLAPELSEVTLRADNDVAVSGETAPAASRR